MIWGLVMEKSANGTKGWEEFNKIFSQEEKANLESILVKAKITTENGEDLKTVLTRQEKIRASNFAWQAILWGLVGRCC